MAIIGCGVIGQKRAQHLGECRLVACADVVLERAQKLAQTVSGALATTDWRTVAESVGVDLVIVATTHDVLAEITLAAIENGKHVLVEKPAARRATELTPLVDAARRQSRLVRVGFNHRYHPAVVKALELVRSGVVGELMYLRARYGHGGRVGYETEWRAQPERSGGGELIDQGVHLIDLARCFLGEFAEIDGFARTYFWKMPVDDNAFMMLKTGRAQVAWLHASCTEWKNQFSMEIFGREGKLEITGLGGSYGVEKLTYYRMLPNMGPPETTTWEYPAPDASWESEFAEFLEDIRQNRQPAANLGDAQAALRIVERIYESSGYDYHA